MIFGSDAVSILDQHLDDLRRNLEREVYVVFDLAIRQFQRGFVPLVRCE